LKAHFLTLFHVPALFALLQAMKDSQRGPALCDYPAKISGSRNEPLKVTETSRDLCDRSTCCPTSRQYQSLVAEVSQLALDNESLKRDCTILNHRIFYAIYSRKELQSRNCELADKCNNLNALLQEKDRQGRKAGNSMLQAIQTQETLGAMADDLQLQAKVWVDRYYLY
jgi:hypothetical protein